jgi:tight adherence protein C
MNIPVADHLAYSGTLILMGALALGIAGMALVLYSARMTREAVTKRVDLIQGSLGVINRGLPPPKALVRSGLEGSKEREQREMARLLLRFGVSSQRPGVILTGLRIMLIIGLGAFGLIVASRWLPASAPRIMLMLVAAGCGISGWFVPAMIIGKLIKARTKSVVAGLPDSLELLVICVEAGLSFEDGIDRVAAVLQKSQPALAEELALTAADLKILASREQALANLALRVDMPSVRSVVTTLSQTLRFGTPLAHALRLVAGELRADTLVRLEERANQLPTLMTIPMMLFIMPTIFMIVAGPAALRVIDAFNH